MFRGATEKSNESFAACKGALMKSVGSPFQLPRRRDYRQLDSDVKAKKDAVLGNEGFWRCRGV